MKIHHLRNATFVIESKDNLILIDPMLCKAGELPPFSRIKHQSQANPLVELPDNSVDILAKVTHCLITHSQKWGIEALTHSDHLDFAGKEFLAQHRTPVVSLKNDAAYLKKHHINITTELKYWEEADYLGGQIIAVPAKHGHGFIHHIMVNGAGFFLNLPDEPSIYISGDTVLTKDVRKAILQFQPDITVVAAGNASLDVGGDILMPIEEILEFIRISPNKVIANHLEALNHCPITREQLKGELIKYDLLDKTYIPDDGDIIDFKCET